MCLYINNGCVRYHENMMDELLEEDPEIDAQRRRCKQMVTVLRKACEVLNTVNDKTVWLRQNTWQLS